MRRQIDNCSFVPPTCRALEIRTLETIVFIWFWFECTTTRKHRDRESNRRNRSTIDVHDFAVDMGLSALRAMPSLFWSLPMNRRKFSIGITSHRHHHHFTGTHTLHAACFCMSKKGERTAARCFDVEYLSYANWSIATALRIRVAYTQVALVWMNWTNVSILHFAMIN